MLVILVIVISVYTKPDPIDMASALVMIMPLEASSSVVSKSLLSNPDNIVLVLILVVVVVVVMMW